MTNIVGAIMKLSSRCNLNCSYCYVYNLGDQSFLNQPRLMEDDVIDHTIRFTADFCKRSNTPNFEFVFHGGEPLLGRKRIAQFVLKARAAFDGVCEVTFGVQTNGILLSRETCEMLRRLGVRVGVSLDGPREYHDRFRVDHKGLGSYDRAVAGWQNAQSSGIAPGLLLVADPTIDPALLMDWMSNLDPRVVDILLPDTTYDLASSVFERQSEPGSYGAWLFEVFTIWAKRSDLSFRIKLFDAIIASLLGQPTSYEGLGGNASATVIIEADGTVEPSDVLKISDAELSERHYTVKMNSMEEVVGDRLIAKYKMNQEMLSPQCLSCDIQHACRGGTLTHRYKSKSGFDNPSIYCSDLFYLITSIQIWLKDELKPALQVD